MLFTDMVGYTAIVDELGEEQALAFTRMVYARLTATIEAHGGTVRGFAGDSIMGVFGIPEALEDAAVRACRAALDIHAAFRAAAHETQAQYGVRTSMRVGISSGAAMMASVEGDDAPITVVGNTVNVASRIQALAPAEGCLICNTTRRLVDGQVELGFDGAHDIRGVSRPQKLWQLLAIRPAATRFDAARARGLGPHVGRAAELAHLAAAMTRARHRLCVADIVAEPGLGKTRLMHEYLQQAQTRDLVVLSGQCSADGRHVPFLPFIDIVRRSFGLRDQDDAAAVEGRLRAGLRNAGLQSLENLGLLLNLLGLKPPAGAFDGLDGVLIGLRTRDLLRDLLDAQCRRGPVVLCLEDIQWIDRASEEMLGQLVQSGAPAHLLIVQTRRPDYAPGWCDAPGVTSLALAPLAASGIRHLAQSRLGTRDVPEDLIAQVTDRAGGNPLHGEEILSFLIDEGMLRTEAGRAVFDAALGQDALPESLQSLFAARIDRLGPPERAVLQAAAVIGRRFDPALLAGVADTDGETGAALRRLEALDIVYREADTSVFVFKHVLMRDCVYHGLLSERRMHLHAAIAAALERHHGDRPEEAAESLAFHYALTRHRDRAFRYNALAGVKSLGVFSLDAANRYFAAALDLYRDDPDCAGGARFAEMVAQYALSLNISLEVTTMLALAADVGPRQARAGDSRDHAVFLHHHVACLIWNGRYRDAWEVQHDLTAMAARLQDPCAEAYASVSELALSCYCKPFANDAFEARRRRIDAALATLDDAYLWNYYLAHLGYNEVSRGRAVAADRIADRLMAAGDVRNDPRCTGYGIAMKALIGMTSDDHETALRLSDDALRASRAEFERAIAGATRHVAMVALRQPGATDAARCWVADCEARGRVLFGSAPDMMLGVAHVIDGRIDAGLAHMTAVIARREAEGYQTLADWGRLFLAEVYLEILSGRTKVPAGVVLRNIRSLLSARIFGPARIVALTGHIRANAHFDPDGLHMARAEMILGLLHKVRKRKARAVQHLTRARAILQPAGASPLLTRIEAALDDLA